MPKGTKAQRKHRKKMGNRMKRAARKCKGKTKSRFKSCMSTQLKK